MQPELSCDQVSALMSFYIENRLSGKLVEHIQRHLDGCPECREKFESLQELFGSFASIKSGLGDKYKEDFEESEKDEFETRFLTKQYDEFKLNLSAYVDNELDDSQNIKIKKMAISNPLARQDLEDMFTFKKVLHMSFEKTKNDAKTDFSRQVLSQLNQNSRRIDPFIQIAIIFGAMVSAVITGVVWILYF